MTPREIIEARLEQDEKLRSARLELYSAAMNYARSEADDADEDYMAGVTARLEMSAERFMEAKYTGPLTVGLTMNSPGKAKSK